MQASHPPRYQSRSQTQLYPQWQPVFPDDKDPRVQPSYSSPKPIPRRHRSFEDGPGNLHIGVGPLGRQFWTSICSMDITSNKCLPLVRSLLGCPSKITSARSLRGSDAQIFVDFLDQALAHLSSDDELRHGGLLLLYKICKTRNTLPTSYILKKDIFHIGRIYYHGGSADVSDGEFDGHPVAIKHLKMNEDSEKVLKRLCREVIGWKHLSHPNVLPFLGVSISMDPYCFCILTQWMFNGNVMQYTSSNPEKNRLQLLFEIASGVAYLHKSGIVHGDLKGANILIDDNGTACLADFGLMRILADHNTIPFSVTTVSSAGTIPWMSPELFEKNNPPTYQSDCYALGMVVYEVLTGLQPFHHLGPYQVPIAVQKGERPKKPPNAESLGLSGTLWGLVLRCWNKSSVARPTAQQLLPYLGDASQTWKPPLEYPIPDGLSGEVGLELTSDDEQNKPAGALTRNLLVLTIGVLCGLIFPFVRARRASAM